jgi:hypothetical protein
VVREYSAEVFRYLVRLESGWNPVYRSKQQGDGDSDPDSRRNLPVALSDREAGSIESQRAGGQIGYREVGHQIHSVKESQPREIASLSTGSQFERKVNNCGQ